MNTKIVFIATLAILSLLGGVGCRPPDDGLKPEQQQMANRLQEITQKSGGDWDKLSDDDRKYLVNDISHGSETSARMLLQARAGRLKAKPGGPPR